MDTIFVKNLSVIGKHGVEKYEWSHEQRFLVDMEVSFDTTLCSRTDNVADTVDYATLCSIAQKTIEGASVYLIEKLATIIAERVLEDTRIESIKVTIRKPTVLPSGVPGVTITRYRTP